MERDPAGLHWARSPDITLINRPRLTRERSRMSKHSGIIGLFSVVACGLTASTIDQVPTFTATSATASWSSLVEFSIFDGPSLIVQGEGLFVGVPLFFAIGAPVIEGCASVGVDCMFQLR